MAVCRQACLFLLYIKKFPVCVLDVTESLFVVISLKQDIVNEKTELEAALKEAESASSSVELLLPLFKNTVEGISLENVSVGLEWLMRWKVSRTFRMT